MRLEEITKDSLKEARDKELLMMRLRFIQLWEKNFKDNDKAIVGSLNRQQFLTKYKMLLSELNSRQLEHSTEGIDRAAFKKAMNRAKNGIDVADLGDLVIVPDYISIGGSFVKDPATADDVDIVVRENEDNRNESFELKVGRAIKEQLDKDCHFIYSPTGPHGSSIPLFDLTLRCKPETAKVEVKDNTDKSMQEYYEGLDNWDEELEEGHKELVKHLSGKTVLSLGCGSGRTEERLKKAGYEVEGVDNNATALKICADKKLKVKEVDLNKKHWDYEDGSVDNVIGMHVLEHLEDPLQVIKEARRIAKRRIVFVCPLGKREDPSHLHTFEDMKAFKEAVVNKCNLSDKRYKLKSVADGKSVVLIIKADHKVEKAALKPFDQVGRSNVLQKAKDEGNVDYKVGDTGRGVIQLHIMGIMEEKIEELKKIRSEVLDSKHNYKKLKLLLKGAIGEQGCHLDIRLVRKGDDYFEGGEIMLGNLTGLDKLAKLDEGGKLRFGWKVPHDEESNAETIRGPVNWMDIGKETVELFPPGEIGATTNQYGAMVVLDEFTFEFTQADKHVKKFEIKGSKLIKEGTYLVAYVPVQEGRVWMISKLKAEEDNKFEKFITVFPLTKGDEHIVCGIVYEPDTEDAQGDMANEAEIRKAAYGFMEDVQIFKVNHKGHEAEVKVLESYIAPCDLTIEKQKVKKGSWVLVTRVLDKELWQSIKKGDITGYSMAGFSRIA